jgi:monofunctional glycosyltransferase
MAQARKNRNLTFGSLIWRWTKRIFWALVITHLVYVVLLKWIDPPFTAKMVTSSIHCLTSKDIDFKRDYIDYNEMGNNAKLAVLSAEDQLFPTHNGFDFAAIQKAIEYNEKNEGKKIRGGSTISQQVAKNVFLWHGRDFIRKGLEVYFTGLIELIWGKKRILEMYLNIAEMGDGFLALKLLRNIILKKLH